MVKYTIRRLLASLIVVIAVSLLSFLVLELAPGDTAETVLRHTFVGYDDPIYEADIEMVSKMYGLSDPLLVQYGNWLKGVLSGNWGVSYVHKVPVWDLVLGKIPYTVALGVMAFIGAFLISVPLGMAVSVQRNKVVDHILRVVTIFFGSIPSFWLCLVLMYILGVRLRLLPLVGIGTPQHYIMPCITLMVGMIPTTFRITRSSMNDVFLQDYMITAKTKGVSQSAMVWRHASRNVLPPVITVAGLEIGHILGGSVIVETVFSWPGIGKLLYDSIMARDVPTMQVCIVLIAAGYVVSMFVVDLVNASIDPRLRVGGGRN